MKLTPEQIASFPWHLISRELLHALRDRILDAQTDPVSGESKACFLCPAIRALSWDRQADLRFGNWLAYCGISRTGSFLFSLEPLYSPWNRQNSNQRRIDILTQLIDS